MTELNRYTGVIEAARGCFLFEADELPQSGPRGVYGSIMIDPGSGQIELLTAREDGPVHLTVEVHDTATPSTDSWAEVAVATVRWDAEFARITQLDMGRYEQWDVALPAPHFVLRAQYREDGETENWLLQLWPEPVSS